MHNNVAGEATKKGLVFDRLLSLSETYFQGSAMAAMGEWRDELCCSKLTSGIIIIQYYITCAVTRNILSLLTCASLDHAVG